MQTFCPIQRSAPFITYKVFVITHLDYGIFVYDKAYNVSFHHKTESGEYNTCLAFPGPMRGTSKLIFYEEIGLESI